MICYAKCFIQLDYGWLFNSGLLFSGGQIVSLFQKMSCCLSPKAYLNRFELLSLLRMKVFFPFKLQIDLILFSFIQDAEGVIAMKNQSDAFYTYNLLLLFAVCVPYRAGGIRTHECRSQSPVPYRLAIPQYYFVCSLRITLIIYI